MRRSAQMAGVVLMVALFTLTAAALAHAQAAARQARNPSSSQAAMEAVVAEAQQRQAALEAIAADRGPVVASILDRWSTAIAERDGDGRVQAKLRETLSAVSPDRLYAASLATSYDDLMEILGGRGASTAPNSLGNPDADLVYTSVTPCRVLDSRFGTGVWAGPWAANSDHYIKVTDAIDAGQGALTTCGVPWTAAKAVVLNITVASPWGLGDLRIYPYLGALPNASILNFNAGQNIANAATVPICRGCAYDLRIKNDAAITDVVVDVMGYLAAPLATALDVTVQTANTVVPVGPTSFDLTSPACPAGTTLTGGGFDQQGLAAATDVWFWSSQPNATNTAWRIRGRNNSSNTVTVTTFAFCAKVPGR